MCEHYDAQHILRITADCPLVDAKLLMNDRFVRISRSRLRIKHPSADLFRWLRCRSVSIETLRRCEQNVDLKSDREHVTSYIRRNFKNTVNLANRTDYSNIRLTLDEETDFTLLNSLAENQLPLSECNWLDFFEKIETGEYVNTNLHIPRNEGKAMSNGQKLYKRAKSIIPGGTMLLSKRPEMFLPNKWPAYFKKASGCIIWDLDENKLLDMSIMGIGTNTLGYGYAAVDEAVQKTIRDGNLSTLNCPEEVWLAEELLQMNPWAGGVRFARTGGEANAIAVRIARAAVGREGVAVCGYHGWHDWYLSANIGSGDELKRHLLQV